MLSLWRRLVALQQDSLGQSQLELISPLLVSFGKLKKAELEEALDGHLVSNRTQYENEKPLADFYRRLNRGSPTKATRRQTITKIKRESPEAYVLRLSFPAFLPHLRLSSAPAPQREASGG